MQEDGLISRKPTFVSQMLAPLSRVSSVLLVQQYKQQLFNTSNKQTPSVAVLTTSSSNEVQQVCVLIDSIICHRGSTYTDE